MPERTEQPKDKCDYCGTTETETWTFSTHDEFGYLCDECTKRFRPDWE